MANWVFLGRDLYDRPQLAPDTAEGRSLADRAAWPLMLLYSVP